MQEREVVLTKREVEARLVPSGTEIMIPADTFVTITQSLGGTFSVAVNGNPLSFLMASSRPPHARSTISCTRSKPRAPPKYGSGTSTSSKRVIAFPIQLRSPAGTTARTGPRAESAWINGTSDGES
jgi:hypothetical protein